MLDGVLPSITDNEEEKESDYAPANESDMELEYDDDDDEYDDFIDNGEERQDDK